MIQLPQRSVTRFFIPLIDVLTLLFCIYLLMPMVSKTDSALTEAERQRLEEKLRDLEAELAQKQEAGAEIPEELRKEIERLRTEQIKTLKDRLAVRVLEIDGKNGHLYERTPAHTEVENQAQGQALIDADRRKYGVGRKELYYLILYPRDPNSGYPTQEQRRRYDRWFEGVALGYDIPGSEDRP
jgi:hypothetical protein